MMSTNKHTNTHTRIVYTHTSCMFHLGRPLPVSFMHANMIYLHDLKWLLGHVM